MRGDDRRSNSPYASGPYDSVRIEDHDDSSTEVDTIDLAEKGYAPPRKTSWLSALKEYGWILHVFLLLVIIVLLMDGHKHGKNHYFEGAGDLTGFAPECVFLELLEITAMGDGANQLRSPAADHQVRAGSGLRTRKHFRVLHRGDAEEVARHRTEYVLFYLCAGLRGSLCF